MMIGRGHSSGSVKNETPASASRGVEVTLIVDYQREEVCPSSLPVGTMNSDCQE